MSPMVGVIANRLIIALGDADIVILAEMTKEQAADFAAEMVVAICQIEAGVTVKKTFDAFMAGFEE